MHIKYILLFVLLQVACGASQNNKIDTYSVEQKEIIDYYKKEIKASESRYIKKRDTCKRKAKASKIVFDWSKIKVNKEDIGLAFRYFVLRNMDICSREEEQKLVYNVNKLMIFKRQEELDFQEEMHTLFILLADQDIFIDDGMKYLNLSKPKRDYFEELFGTKPYGLNAVEEFFKEWKKIEDSK